MPAALKAAVEVKAVVVAAVVVVVAAAVVFLFHSRCF
jgi:hypothetical protein